MNQNQESRIAHSPFLFVVLVGYHFFAEGNLLSISA